MAGPVLAAIGAIALLPLAVQPARGRARRALQAFAGVFAAVAVAGLRGSTLPLTGVAVSNLGDRRLDERHRPSSGPVVALLQANPGFVALAAVLAAVGGPPAGRAQTRASAASRSSGPARSA